MNAELLIGIFIFCMLLSILGMVIVMGRKMDARDRRMNAFDEVISKVKKKRNQVIYLALLLGWRIKF